MAPLQGASRERLDAELIRRAAHGDLRALGDLYDAYSGVVLALGLRIVRDRAEAEDIVHDAFVAVWERAGQFSPERGTVAAWLVTTVRNLALDRARRRARRAKIGEEALRHEPRAPSADPEQLWSAARDAGAVQGALSSLSPGQRATLETAFFEGLTYAEIAERDNVPLGTVKSRAARALAALRQALDLASNPSGGALTEPDGVR